LIIGTDPSAAQTDDDEEDELLVQIGLVAWPGSFYIDPPMVTSPWGDAKQKA
jgi:hypothetical protein